MDQIHSSVIAKIKRQLALVVGSGRINQYTKGRLAQTTWEDNDQEENTRIWQHFGFKSRPPIRTDCVGICSGSRDKIIVIATDNENDIEVLEGESLLYAEQNGSVSCKIHLGNDGKVTIEADKIQIKNSSNVDLLSKLQDCFEKIAKSKAGQYSLEPFASEYNQKIKSVIKSFLVS